MLTAIISHFHNLNLTGFDIIETLAIISFKKYNDPFAVKPIGCNLMNLLQQIIR
ncbi:hypothetical protein SDC9_91015 [bioreactor metagenome]|uniref:Uncharacterized protein n=1 Tax=bioreactor metagenome TaxID=1076179 RepID=A0A644ZU89_9ZZZZ